MTRKDLHLTALAFRKTCTMSDDTRERFATELAYYLLLGNPHFDTAKFIADCMKPYP